MRRAICNVVALASFVAVASAGCVGAPPVDEATEAATTAFANDKPAYDFFVAKGLTNFQAAGIVGNLDQESGVDPGAVQFGGGPGRGIAQWSVGGRWDTSANDNVLAYAKQKGASSGSLNLQLEFIWYELTSIGYGYAQLKATTNVTDATLAFMDKYEICGTCASSQRIAYAKSVLSAYGAAPAYSAAYVSQSWPLASQPAFQVKCGQRVAAQIVLKNTGTKTWDSSTKLGTTMQRDRASIFAGSDWLASNRAAAIKGTVAPGADGTFAFAFDGPTGKDCVPGSYSEFFGVVQEGVAWFSDNGQGGPPDNQIEAVIDLVPGDPGAGDDGGVGAGGSGGSGGGDDGGTGGGGGGDGTGGGTGGNGDGTGAADNPGGNGAAPHGGCSMAGAWSSSSPSSSSGGAIALLLACALVLAARRRSAHEVR
jgi:hypothetical protein